LTAQPTITYEGELEPGVSATFYSDRVLLVTFATGLPAVDRETVVRWRKRIAEAIEGPYVTVGDLHNLGFIDQGARAEFAGDHDGRVLATAPTVGRGPVIPFLVDLWRTENEIDRPVEVFEDVGHALAWAHETAARLHAEGRFAGQG
jgi:hypothetical protein